jgi:hypothetical protein
MLTMPKAILVALAFALATGAHAQVGAPQPTPPQPTPASGAAVDVLNAFIATFAKEDPRLKTEIVLTNDPSVVPAGKQLGYSRLVGYYSFRPKTWAELSDDERMAVLHDNRLRAFIVSLRNTSTYPSLTNALPATAVADNALRFPVENGKVAVNTPVLVKIPADEMVNPRGIKVFVFNSPNPTTQ